MQHSAGKPDNSAVRPDNRTFCPKTGLSGLKPDTWQPYDKRNSRDFDLTDRTKVLHLSGHKML